MKKIVTILLIVSLYSPQIAQFLSYSNCAILATFNVDISLCDCLKETNKDYKFIDGTLQSQAKTSTTNYNWNYTNTNAFNINIQPILSIVNQPFSAYCQVFPNAPASSVFRPPC